MRIIQGQSCGAANLYLANPSVISTGRENIRKFKCRNDMRSRSWRQTAKSSDGAWAESETTFEGQS
jgi:hypothetical protein